MSSRKRIVAGITPVAATLAIAACGASTGTSGGGGPPSSAATRGAPASSSQAAPGGVTVTGTAHQGQPFTAAYIYIYTHGTSQQWQVTLDSITCGTGAIFSQAIINELAASEGDTAVQPQPRAGNKFCLVKFSNVNQSTSNQNWQASLESTVNVAQNAYTDTEVGTDDGGHSAGTGWDAEQAYTQYAQPPSEDSDFGIQPQASAVSWAVFEVPQAAKVTSVSVLTGGGSATGQATQVVIPVP